VPAVKINHAPMEGKRKKQRFFSRREWAIADRMSGKQSGLRCRPRQLVVEKSVREGILGGTTLARRHMARCRIAGLTFGRLQKVVSVQSAGGPKV
jgi:hypothetical protein